MAKKAHCHSYANIVSRIKMHFSRCIIFDSFINLKQWKYWKQNTNKKYNLYGILYPILMKYILIILCTVEFESTEPIVINIYQSIKYINTSI